MDLLNEVSVTLVVKAPNQKVADQTVECALNWTVRKLKEHLARVYPSNPTENQQKIIYSGRLLHDDVTLKEILRPQGETKTVHTVHLVCCNLSSPDVSTSQNVSITSSNSSTSTSEGLRHRRTASPSETTQPQDGIPQQLQQQHLPTEQSSTTTTNSAAERLQFPASAFHPSHYNPFMSAYLPHGAVGMTMPPGANNSTYSVEQMMWLQQQAYVHYMTNYMQLFQQGIVPPGQPVPPFTAPPALPNQNVAPDQPANAIGRQQPPVMRMNAQGGPVVNDDDDEMDRDWLDWFYVGVRFALLMCILYFYSTPARFFVTLLLMVVVCLLQNGRLHALFRPRQDEAPAANAPADPDGLIRDDADAADQPDGGDTGETVPEEPRQFRGLALVWEVFVAFFVSLAPQPPPPINAN